jgi:hypothetical protein
LETPAARQAAVALVWIIHATSDLVPKNEAAAAALARPARNGAAKAGKGAGGLAFRVVLTINLSRLCFYGSPARLARRNSGETAGPGVFSIHTSRGAPSCHKP